MSLCDDCLGLCCKKAIGVYPSDEVYTDSSLTIAAAGDHYYDREMVTNNGWCISLLDGRCTIYDKRPSECKIFEMDGKCCKEFREGIKIEHTCQDCIISKEANKSHKGVSK